MRTDAMQMRMRMRMRWAGLSVAALLVATSAACGGGGGGGGGDAARRPPVPAVPEPAVAPPATASPAGRVVDVEPGANLEGIVLSPTDGLVAVGSAHPDGVLLLDRQGARVALLPLAGAPRHLELVPPSTVLAPSEGSDELVPVDLATRTALPPVKVGRQPHDVAAVGTHIVVGNELADTASLVEGGRVVGVVPVPLQPGGLASDGRDVAVVGVRGRRIAFLDPVTGRSRAELPCGVGPTHVVAEPGGRFFVADTQGDAVLVYAGGAKPRQVGRAAAPGTPYGMAIDAGRHRLWITATARNELLGFDTGPAVPKLVVRLPTVRQPNSVAVDPGTGVLYVTGTDGGQVEVIPPPA